MQFASTGTQPGWSEFTMEGTGGRQVWWGDDFEPCSLKFLGPWVKSALPSNIALHASLFGRVTQSAMA